MSTALSTDDASERIAKEIGVISKDNTAVHDTTSQSDGRPTAIAVGAGACIFMAAVILLLLILDLTTITTHLKLMKRNLSWMFSGWGQKDPALISTQKEATPSITDLHTDEAPAGQEVGDVDNVSVNVTLDEAGKF